MQKVLAIVCGALMIVSAPAFAQTVSPNSNRSSPNLMQPSSGSAALAQPAGTSDVNYQSGLQALGQVPQDQDENRISTGAWIAGGLILGGGVAAALLIANNESKAVSP